MGRFFVLGPVEIDQYSAGYTELADFLISSDYVRFENWDKLCYHYPRLQFIFEVEWLSRLSWRSRSGETRIDSLFRFENPSSFERSCSFLWRVRSVYFFSTLLHSHRTSNAAVVRWSRDRKSRFIWQGFKSVISMTSENEKVSDLAGSALLRRVRGIPLQGFVE